MLRLRRSESQESADAHGEALFRGAFTINQVVHDYGDLCQVITSLAIEQAARLDSAEFRTLNLCLDDAIAGAVAAYSREHARAAAADGSERLGPSLMRCAPS